MIKIEAFQYYHERLKRHLPASRFYYEEVIRGKTVVTVELLAGSDFKVPRKLWAPLGMRIHTLLVGQNVLFEAPALVEREARKLAKSIREARARTAAGLPLPEPWFSEKDLRRWLSRFRPPKRDRPLAAGTAHLALGAIEASGLGRALSDVLAKWPHLIEPAKALVANQLGERLPLDELSRQTPLSSGLLEVMGLDYSGDPLLLDDAAEALWDLRKDIWPFLAPGAPPSSKIFKPWRAGSPLMAPGDGDLLLSLDSEGRLLGLAPLPDEGFWLDAANELGARPGDLAVFEAAGQPVLGRESERLPALGHILHHTLSVASVRLGKAAGVRPEAPGWRAGGGALLWRPITNRGMGPALAAVWPWSPARDRPPKSRVLAFRAETDDVASSEALVPAALALLKAESALMEADLAQPGPPPLAMAAFLAAWLLDYIQSQLAAADLWAAWPEVKAVLGRHLLYTGSDGRRKASSLAEAKPYYAALDLPPKPASSLNEAKAASGQEGPEAAEPPEPPAPTEPPEPPDSPAP
jgi:hypothetical protein